MNRQFAGRPLLAAIGLVLATNLVVLVGVAWNRGGEPGSELVLTQRELGTPWTSYRNKENSGVALHIAWRVTERDDDDGADAVDRMRYMYMDSYSRSPAWLDEAKMLALGFALPPAVDSEFSRYRSGTPAREVFLVLELDGPAYRASLERAQHLLDQARKAAADHPGKPDLAKRAEDVQKTCMSLREKSSRLFVVDAGLDAAVLRARYPDRAHYAIVRGRIGPELAPRKDRKDEVRLGGYIEELSVGEIHAPADWLPASPRESIARDGATEDSAARANAALTYEAKVAWGRRMEPWIVTATPVRVVAAPGVGEKADGDDASPDDVDSSE